MFSALRETHINTVFTNKIFLGICLKERVKGIDRRQVKQDHSGVE